MTKNVNLIHTEEELVNALIDGGIPKAVAEDIGLAFTVTELRKPVETDDLLTLKMVHNVGDKRAQIICDLLKGRIPAPMSNPKPDIQKPDTEMRKVPALTLVFENGEGKLTTSKVDKNGNKILKNGKPVRNEAMKRFGPALQKLIELNGGDMNLVFTTTSEIAQNWDDPQKDFEMRSHWHRLTHYGYRMNDGTVYVPAIMGTNAKMKCQVHWIQVKNAAALKTWMHCGANFTKKEVNLAKIKAYEGLLLPYTKQLLDNRLNPTMEVLTPEWKNEHEGKNVLISPDGTMVPKEAFVVNEFDGMLFIELTPELIKKMGLKRHELRRLKRAIAKFNGGTLRGPWHKAVIVEGYHIHDSLRDKGVTHVNGKPIEDIAIFGDMSVFKAALGKDELYEKFEDFSDNFIYMKHRFGVLLENHGIKKTFLPAQQLQAAHGCDPKYIEDGAEMEVAYLTEATDPKVAAARYTPGVIARIAQDDPTIMTAWFATEMALTGYNKEFKSALAGRTHGENRTGFVIKDCEAYAEWIAYNEGKRDTLPTGCLSKYDVFAPGAGLTGKAVASRNPVIANYGLVVVNVVDTVGEADKYFDEGFPYIMVGIHDDLCKKLRMDHDGDKIRLTFDEWFIKAVESIEIDGTFAEWDNFGEPIKDYLTDKNEADFWDTCTVTPTLGLNVDACSKMIANGRLTSLAHNMVADYMMNKGTDVKQGADGSRVDGEAGEYWNEMKAPNKDELISIAMAYGKMEKGRVVDPDTVAKEYGDSNLDIISKAVMNNAPRTLAYNGYFDLHKVMYGNTKTVNGLVGSWYDKEAKDWKANLFDAMVARNRDMWAEMDENAKSVGLKDYLDWQKAQARKELEEFAEANGVRMADVYDTITLYVFEKLRLRITQLQTNVKNAQKEDAKVKAKSALDKAKKWCMVLARTYIQWFGDILEEVYCTNNELGFLKPVDCPVDCEESIWE